jgi:hypothetical protein
MQPLLSRILHLSLLIFVILILSACAGFHSDPSIPKRPVGAYLPIDDHSDFSLFSPLFLIEEHHLIHNRIGSPAAVLKTSGEEFIYVDSENPAIFVQKTSFHTETNSYKNFIYRIHFKEVPLHLSRFYLTSGANVGILIIVTVNEDNLPVLLTTVHTCGCFLSFHPTSFLQEDAYPANWDKSGQNVFGEKLPGLLDLGNYSATASHYKFILSIRSDTHRIMDIRYAPSQTIDPNNLFIDTPIKPMEDLLSLPLDQTTTSFFEHSGPRTGYVKRSFKPFERLLMSWWSFDLHVGEDKAYFPDEQKGTLFYTSLKFWDRTESDMRNFPQFLKYWGWNL